VQSLSSKHESKVQKQPAGPPLNGMQRPLAPASAHWASLEQIPPPPLLPPKLQPPGGGVGEHLPSVGRWFTGTRPPPELLEEPPLLELPPEDPPLPLPLLEPPPEELEPPLDAPLDELPPELEELLPPSAPPSPGETKTVPPQAQREVSEANKASARRMTDPPVGRLSNCSARLVPPCFSRDPARHIVPRTGE
jgi:hypothetical protein